MAYLIRSGEPPDGTASHPKATNGIADPAVPSRAIKVATGFNKDHLHASDRACDFVLAKQNALLPETPRRRRLKDRCTSFVLPLIVLEPWRQKAIRPDTAPNHAFHDESVPMQNASPGHRRVPDPRASQGVGGAVPRPSSSNRLLGGKARRVHARSNHYLPSGGGLHDGYPRGKVIVFRSRRLLWREVPGPISMRFPLAMLRSCLVVRSWPPVWPRELPVFHPLRYPGILTLGKRAFRSISSSRWRRKNS